MGNLTAVPLNPWKQPLAALLEALTKVDELLLSGPVGCELINCVTQLHKEFGGPIKFVECTSNASLLTERLKGKSPLFYDEYDTDNRLLDTEVLNGIVVLFEIQLCNTYNLNFLSTLISKRTAEINGISFKLDEDAKIIGLFTDTFDESLDPSIKQIFGHRISIPRISSSPQDILGYIVWFFQQRDSTIKSIEFEAEAAELIKEYQWPGDRQELKQKSSIIFGDLFGGKFVSAENCKRLFEGNIQYLDLYHEEQIQKLLVGIEFRGKPFPWKQANEWILQFLEIADHPSQLPWEIGYRILHEITRNYFFDDNRTATLLSSACTGCPIICTNTPNIAFLDPEPGIKSNPAISRKVYLYLAERFAPAKLGRIPLSELKDTIQNHTNTNIIICADDFVGTGLQTVTTYLKPIKELINTHNCQISLYFIFAVGYQQGLEYIKSQSSSKLNISTYCGLILSDVDRAFHTTSSIFTSKKIRDKARRLIQGIVGKSLFPEWPAGFGDVQSLVVFSDNVPDDTIPAISMAGIVRGYNWKPLFPRFDTSLTCPPKRSPVINIK